MSGSAGILIALISFTIVLIVVFLVRPSITAGAAGKVLAFIALGALPALCLSAGMFTHMQRSEQTKFCISCHSMKAYGQSLYVDDPQALPAAHFQNHRIPPEEACYSCHADYSLYGPLKDKMAGVTRIYMQYISRPPAKIEIPGGYNNQQCLHCHGGARAFEENPVHSAMMDTLKSNQMSCISSGCHETVHNASEVSREKMWRPGE